MTSVAAPATIAPAAPAKRRRPGFVEKTLAGISHNIEQAIFSEENARRDAFLQRRDPRVKLASFVFLVVATGIARDWRVLLALYALTIVGMAAGRLDARAFFKRVWLGIPFFSAIVVLPSIFFIDGKELFSIPIGFTTLTATGAGLGAAGIFVLRVAVSVSFAILLILTTPWADVLKAFRFFRVPTVFVLILGMAYRYIFLLLHTVNGMFESRRSRVVARTTGKEQRWWIVSSMSVLMSKSFRMSDEVYQAMLARGFTGQVRTLTDYRMAAPDWALGAFSAAAAGLAIFVNGWL